MVRFRPRTKIQLERRLRLFQERRKRHWPQAREADDGVAKVMGLIADNFARVREQIARFGVLRIAICRKTGLPLSIWLGCAVAGSWGILNALNYRDAMNPDGISYLVLTIECSPRGPLSLINSYRRVLYPAFIAFNALLFHPGPAAEFAYVHGLNA